MNECAGLSLFIWADQCAVLVVHPFSRLILTTTSIFPSSIAAMLTL